LIRLGIVKKIREIKQELRTANSRDYLLFTMGTNVALRASSLLNIKVADVFDEKGNVVRYLWIREKTGKEKKLSLNSVIEEALLFDFKNKRILRDNFPFTAERSDEQLVRQAL